MKATDVCVSNTTTATMTSQEEVFGKRRETANATDVVSRPSLMKTMLIHFGLNTVIIKRWRAASVTKRYREGSRLSSPKLMASAQETRGHCLILKR